MTRARATAPTLKAFETLAIHTVVRPDGLSRRHVGEPGRRDLEPAGRPDEGDGAGRPAGEGDQPAQALSRGRRRPGRRRPQPGRPGPRRRGGRAGRRSPADRSQPGAPGSPQLYRPAGGTGPPGPAGRRAGRAAVAGRRRARRAGGLLAGADPVRTVWAVWAAQLGGLTSAVHGDRRRFVGWAAAYVGVTEVLDRGGDAHRTWLVAAPVPGGPRRERPLGARTEVGRLRSTPVPNPPRCAARPGPGPPRPRPARCPRG